jgi:hypothetical protein
MFGHSSDTVQTTEGLLPINPGRKRLYNGTMGNRTDMASGLQKIIDNVTQGLKRHELKL